MAVGDGRYVAIADVQNYADSITSQTATWNSVGLAVMASCIQRAEGVIDGYCGSSFDSNSVTELSAKSWIDWQGWIHLVAHSYGPVTAVTSARYRLRSDTQWQTLVWNGADNCILPLSKAPPRPDSWHVQIYPAAPLLSYSPQYPAGGWDPSGAGFAIPNGIAASDIMLQWTYTGGYGTVALGTIPPMLAAMATRLAFFYYKLREAPMSRIVTAELGLMEIPLDLPKDIKQELFMWRRVDR